MSRSNPHDGAANPSTRWFEWNGEQGLVRYYDKDQKKNVDVGQDFTFILLDELASVRGWDESTKSGIYSNEVRDTRQDILIVRSFKGGTLVEGLYKDIKDRANSLGGSYTANCYLAYKNGADLKIGCVRFKGAALGAWMEFRKAHRSELYTKGVRINGFTEGKNGRVTYRMPQFETKEVSSDTNSIAVALDKELQDFLAVYLKKSKRDQVEQAAATHLRDEDIGAGYDTPTGAPPPLTEDDIPF